MIKNYFKEKLSKIRKVILSLGDYSGDSMAINVVIDTATQQKHNYWLIV